MQRFPRSGVEFEVVDQPRRTQPGRHQRHPCSTHAIVTHAELHYEGSCAIDGRLLDISGIREYEQVHIYNINSGHRFVTYAIRGEEGSGIISVNGAAAHCAQPGDLVIICAYAEFDEVEAARYKPTLVYVDGDNKLTHTNHSIPAQAA